MRKRIKRNAGIVLVLAMLIVMIYPGKPSKAADGFIIVDGVLTGYEGVEKIITIPDEVTAIGNDAFTGKDIISVSIGNNVTRIGEGAFRWCDALVSVTIPSSVTEVGTGAFQNCVSLSEVTWMTNAGIPDYAFDYCTGLEKLNLSTGLTSIGDSAFQNCESLSSFTVPAGTSSIALGAFNGCTRMSSIRVEDGNTNYSSYGDCLYGGYNGNVASLIRCPQGKQSINIQESTTIIAPYAFYGCIISTVEIPSKVVTISDNAFEKSKVSTLILGKSVAQFGVHNQAKFSVIKVASGAPIADNKAEFENMLDDGVMVEYNYDASPVVPENPDEPNQPEDPENPDEPNQPEDPENPDEPNQPEDPENPDKPNTPENPDKPSQPEDPENPDEPNTPENPDEPNIPTNPSNPIKPDDSNNPINPDDNKVEGEKIYKYGSENGGLVFLDGGSVASGNSGVSDNNSGDQSVASNTDSTGKGSQTLSIVNQTTGTSGSGTRVKDNTPSTGEEMNAKYILCMGVMLLGIYLILSSRKEAC